MRILFYEAAAIVNHRPLSVTSLNNHEEVPLTPNMILTGKSEPTPPPPGEFSSDSLYCKARWKKVQSLAEEFWRQWKVQYLDNITKRQVWKAPKENLKPNDIVLVRETDQPRNLWKTGIIEQVQYGSDGLVRNSTVRLSTRLLDSRGRPMEKPTILQRPVQKLVRLMGIPSLQFCSR